MNANFFIHIVLSKQTKMNSARRIVIAQRSQAFHHAPHVVTHSDLLEAKKMYGGAHLTAAINSSRSIGPTFLALKVDRF